MYQGMVDIKELLDVRKCQGTFLKISGIDVALHFVGMLLLRGKVCQKVLRLGRDLWRTLTTFPRGTVGVFGVS